MASNNQGNQGNNQGNQGNNQNSGGRGFASMDPDKQREIASEGGRAAHASGNAHEFTSEEARKAGSMSHGGQGSSSQGGTNSNRGSAQGSGNQGSSGTQGGSSEQHAEAGRQSHKNSR